MTTSTLSADSLLAVDIGQISTRAILFDVVDGRYRFLSAGAVPTTLGAPYFDVGEGVRHALDRLHEITGRTLLGADERLIMPTRVDGSGVDTFVASISAGSPLNVVVIGLLEDISVESARHLAETTYARVVETFSMNDRRKQEVRIDTILRLHPDLIVIAGGTDSGASNSVLRLLESVGLACYLAPQGHKPEVLFAGNQVLVEEVLSSLKPVAGLYIAPNIRPVLDVEQLEPAHVQMTEIYRAIRSRQLPGVKELDTWSGGRLLPSASAFGRVIRFLSQVYDSAKGVLGIDVGASATTVAASFAGDLSLGVYPQLGLGAGLPSLLNHTSIGEISRWLSVEVSDDDVRDYIYHKAIFPASVPATEEDLAIESALARQAMSTACRLAAAGFARSAERRGSGLLPWFEPIVAAGSVLTCAPSVGHSLLMVLDALQPTGITTIVLDQNNLSASLGAAARINPALVVQVLESRTFLSLGTVISPISNARTGAPILRLRITYASGEEKSLDVKQGALEVLPLPLGQAARINLQPLHRADIGMGGAGRSGNVRVLGGALGVVVDARGRPLRLPDDAVRRRELFKKWLWTLGG